MVIMACGVNHRTAPLQMRETLSFAVDDLQSPLQELAAHPHVNEAVILSTCNRTEIYCRMDSNHSATVIDWLTAKSRLESLKPHVYIHQDAAAIKHMLRVASGLDSMMLGEPQILGQLKAAYSHAHHAGTLGKELDRLFQYVFSVSKRVRHGSGIGSHPVSLAFAAVNLGKQIFTDYKQTTALLIGAGDTIELTAQHLRSQGVKNLIIANRSRRNAETLANHHGANAISLNEIPHYLCSTDIIITATASPLPILGKGSLESAFKKRKHRPLFIVDLAVPRDVEPEIRQMDDVYLYDLDDLQTIITQSLTHRQQAAFKAEDMIDAHTKHFIHWLDSLDSVTTIRQYRQQADTLRQDELSKALQQLQQGEQPHIVLERFANNLTHKFIHKPTVRLRQASLNNQLEIIDAARRLFDLNEIE